MLVRVQTGALLLDFFIRVWYNYCMRKNKFIYSCAECDVVIKRYWRTDTENKFCSRSCAAKYNNKKYPKRSTVSSRAKVGTGACKYCSSKIRPRGQYCNMACKANFDAMEFGQKWKESGSAILSESNKRLGKISGTARRYIFLVNNSKCSRCGWTHDFGDESFAPLECSHIDGDHSNGNFDNIELLCPNCHAVDTRLNPVKRGKGRWSNGADPRNFSLNN